MNDTIIFEPNDDRTSYRVEAWNNYNLKNIQRDTGDLSVDALTIASLKRILTTTHGIPPDQMRLIFSGKIASDDDLLEDWKTYNLVLTLKKATAESNVDQPE